MSFHGSRRRSASHPLVRRYDSHTVPFVLAAHPPATAPTAPLATPAASPATSPATSPIASPKVSPPTIISRNDAFRSRASIASGLVARARSPGTPSCPHMNTKERPAAHPATKPGPNPTVNPTGSPTVSPIASPTVSAAALIRIPLAGAVALFCKPRAGAMAGPFSCHQARSGPPTVCSRWRARNTSHFSACVTVQRPLVGGR